MSIKTSKINLVRGKLEEVNFAKYQLSLSGNILRPTRAIFESKTNMVGKSLTHIIWLCTAGVALFNCSDRELREERNPFDNKLRVQYEVRETDDGSFLKDGFYKEWHENGQIKVDCSYKLNLKHGKFKSFFETGQIEFDTYYDSGKCHGDQLRYYLNGKKAWEGKYKKGQKVGLWNNWFASGQVKAAEKYNSLGKLEGEQKYWFSNGQLSSSGATKDGLKIGVWNKYDESGQLKRVSNFQDGKDITIIGKWQIDNGNFIEYLPDNTFILVTKQGKKEKGVFELDDDETLILKPSTSFGINSYVLIQLTNDYYKINESGWYGNKTFTAKRI